MSEPILSNNPEECSFTDYIDSLIQKDEAVDLEFKTAKNGLPNSLWDTYSSFANTCGGVIALGVKEHQQQFIVEGLTKEQVTQYKKDFWNQVNNPDCVNFNLLTDTDLYDGIYKGKRLLIIYVPRANRTQRPIYRTRNPFGGHTFKRNNEGDYKCTDAEVKRMIADSDDNHPRDSRILSNYTIDDVDPETLAQYRRLFATVKPSHPWLSLNDMELLTKLNAYRKDRQTKTEGFTLAGILMFGKTESITDPECAPYYFPDFREHLSTDTSIRWTDRICPDGTWEANLFQFYRRVYPKLTAVLPVPFRLENGIRIDETPTHIALREAFINSLIHCDYAEEGNIVIEQWITKYRFKNPGTMLVSRAQYYLGGDSVCRNKALQKMFMLIGYSEKAGSGVNKIMTGWEKANRQMPYVEESNQPDKVELTLPMESLLPDDVLTALKQIFGKRIDYIEHNKLITLATCYAEGKITNDQLQYTIAKHSSDISKMLKSLCQEGYLTSVGSGRGTKYHICNLQKVESSEQKVESTGQKVESSEQKVESTEQKVESTEPTINQTKKNLKFNELEAQIVSIAIDYVTLEEIANKVNKNIQYLINKIIPKMMKGGSIERLYPGTPNHPKQKYRATLHNNHSTDNNR